ncbi:hypothetical protein [Bacillus sp. NTK034]|uniref:hypothetical protein n=1 Tax=Bacillus sp. NTK034 TaxID=2802176 RepID=UPI001A8DE037|nr:hypothetical protein [Bacillus sp. NTK034]MBN8199292.1 hypothetical protein [Bacillus sp. NTK034]
MVLTRKEKLEQLINKLKSQGVKIDWAARICSPKEGSKVDLGYVLAMIFGTYFIFIMGILIGDFTSNQKEKQ